MTITGGTFNGAKADLYVTSEGGKGTTANRIIAIAGGTFGHKPDVTYIATGYVAKNNDNGTWTVREKADASFVAQIGGVKYTTLAAAITAAQNGDTVKLLANETVGSTISVNKNLKLDLGGKTLTGTSCRALHITGGKLELTGSGTVTSSTGIDVRSSVIRVGDNTGGSRTAELVIGKDVVIEAPASYGVGAFGTVTTETLTIYGTVKSTTATNGSYDGCAVTTLGTDTSTPATIIIKGGAKISATNTNAVYLPAGSLTVEGGEITGTTGIYFKSTNMTISGGTITGNGVKQVYQEYHNGGISTGEAVTIDSCNYPGGIGFVSIRGGEFSSTHANAIGSYNSNSGSLQTNFVTGGTFSSNPSAYVAEGYIALVNNDDRTFTVSNTDEIPVTTATVQDYLDGKYGSINGKTLVLASGDYSALKLAPAAYAGSNTTYTCPHNDSTDNTGSVTFTSVVDYKQHMSGKPHHGNARIFTRTLNNLTITAQNGAEVTIAGFEILSRTYYGDSDPFAVGKTGYEVVLNVKNLTFSNVKFTAKVEISSDRRDTTIDGVTFNSCVFETEKINNTNKQALNFSNSLNNGNVRNLKVDGCKFSNCYQGVFTNTVKNILVTSSEFSGTFHNAIAVQTGNDAVNHGAVVISGNTFTDIGDRIIRFNNVGAGTQITITHNTATNSGDSENQVIKATSLAEGVKYNIHDNSWGEGKIVFNDELKDSPTGPM